MALSFDPDWKVGGWTSATSFTLAAPPAGAAGDTLAIFWVLSDDVTPTAVVQRDSGGSTISTMGDASTNFPSGTPDRRSGVSMDFRHADLDSVRYTFPSAVAGGYVAMNLPPGNVPFFSGGYQPDGIAVPGVTPDTIAPSLSPYTVLIGAACSANSITMTPSGAGEFDARQTLSGDWMRAFIFETTDPAAEVEASASTAIRFWRLLSTVAAARGPWTVGRVVAGTPSGPWR